MKLKNYVTFVLVLIAATLYAQDPNIIWQRTIGGESIDIGSVVESTPDGGFIIGGFSTSGISGEKSEDSRGGNDYWVIKIDLMGEIEWQRTIGGSMGDFLHSITLSTDGGYILGGYSSSDISGEKSENSLGGIDCWVIKLDSSGNIQWQNTIGGSNTETITKIITTNDGGYLLNCLSNSNMSVDKSENSLGGYDYWVIKLDYLGNIVWDNTIGGNNDDRASSIVKTNDNGFIICGSSKSNISGDKTEDTNGLTDYWIVKLNSSGNIQWQNTIGGNSNDNPHNIIETNDGGFLVGGHSGSDISGDKIENSQGLDDFWVIKLDNSGNIQWQNTIGGNKTDISYSMVQKNNGNFIIGGYSDSDNTGDKIEANIGANDYWIVELNNSGVILNQNTLGGIDDEILTSINLNSNGELLLAGASNSNISGDKTESSRGREDYWIVKHSANLGLDENALYSTINIYPNPAKNSLQLNADNQQIDQVKIFSVKGDLVQQIEGFETSKTIDVSPLASGIYYVQFTAGRQIATKKFIKQ